AKRAVQRGNVGVAEQSFRTVYQCTRVESAEQPHCTIAAAKTPHAIDVARRECRVEIGEAMLVGAREVAVLLEHMRADAGCPAERMRLLGGPVELRLRAERPRGRDERDARAGSEWCWMSHRAQRRGGFNGVQWRARASHS